MNIETDVSHVHNNRVALMMNAHDEKVDRSDDLVMSSMLENLRDLFAAATDRLSATGAAPVALDDCHEIEQSVEREATQNFMLALERSLKVPYLRILNDMVDVSRSMLTQAATFAECEIVLNWMSSLAIRSLGFTMERDHRSDTPGEAS